MKLIIIGAGVSGLAAAYTINQQAPHISLHCIEKSRGLGGRAATRRRSGATFDHGAQFFRTSDSDQLAFLTQTLPHDQLIDIAKPVGVFDQYNQISAGDPAQNTAPKLVYRSGMNYLAKLLVPKELTVSLQTRLHHVVKTATGYDCIDDQNTVIAHGDALLFTPPAPQTIEILQASQLDPAMIDHLCGGLAPATYRPCLSVTMAFDGRIEFPFYAMVNSDRQHPFSWVAFEHDKDPSRAPADQTLVTIQLAPAASTDWWQADEATLITELLPRLNQLLSSALPSPLWLDRQGWKYALPNGKADHTILETYEQSDGLYFTGDALAGLGRIHLAMEHGMNIAQRIIAQH